ncbi:response regulator [Candidatus Wolfebacteria bacterium]|nr:response regulator [Candidatus Wolfebacteria bacterium]
MNNVLIVEDEKFLVRALQDSLSVEGYKVDVAFDGEEAVGKIRSKNPDIILLDILMPKKDGFYVLEELKKNPEWKTIPVIVLSNLSGDVEIKKALAMGAVDYFVKSQHSLEEVIEKIKDHLGGKRGMV